MTETSVAVTPSGMAVKAAVDAMIEAPDVREVDELEVARELGRQGGEAGLALTGPGGLLTAMTKTVIETPWMRRWPSTWAITFMPSRAAVEVTLATEPGPRPCSQMLAGRSDRSPVVGLNRL